MKSMAEDIQRKARIRVLKKVVAEGTMLPPARVQQLVEVLVEAEKIATFHGIDTHKRLKAAIDAVLADTVLVD